MSDCAAPNNLHDVKEALKKRYRAADIPATSDIGVYALYLSDPLALGTIEVDPSGLLYIGMTEDSLEVRDHFGHKDSAFSSPRRSLGAILKKELELTAIPRGLGRSAKDMTCYRFAGGGEKELSKWMVKHLECGFAVLEDSSVGDVERELIECLRPPLNLDKWDNPQKKTIKRLRRACADEARNAAPPAEQP
jgi:hypothetical protein